MIMAKIGIIGRLKHFFGFFNTTEFEQTLILKLRESVDTKTLNTLDDQLARFNRVQRVLVDDSRLKCGSTMFYWVKSGKSLIDKFPKRIDELENMLDANTFFQCVIEDSTGNQIRVEFKAVRGVFVLLNFYSSKRIWYPIGSYKFLKVENLLPQLKQ
jgi:hypothetical protein